jgi:uncharacterized membrane protein YfcA
MEQADASQSRKFMRLAVWLVLALAAMALASEPAIAQSVAPSASVLPWWAWVLLLFVVTFALGVVAIVAGVGGGVLFVPIVGGLFPFHLDFVRGTGLLIALAGALAAGPTLLRGGMANLQLAVPPALTASAAAIVGAMIGMTLPESIIQLALGTMILGVVGLMVITRKSDKPEVPKADALSAALRMQGFYHDPFSGRDIEWRVHRTPQGLALFALIGALGGLFGIGAGWANVPALNLVMGVPLKVSIGTSSVILSIANSAAAWVYLNHGAMLAIIAVPSMLGMMLGSTIGVGLLSRTNVAVIRRIVIVLLLLAGIRALLKGLGV